MGFEMSVKPPVPFDGECEQHGPYAGTISYILGREFPSKCPECLRIKSEEDAARQKQQDDMAKQLKLSQKLGGAAIPARFSDRSLESYQASTARQEKALGICRDYAEGFAEHRKSGRCLMLMGLPGTGKTHLACGIANYLIRETEFSAAYRTVGGMLIEIKASYDRNSERSEAQVMAALTLPSLLVLDEIGATKPSEFELATLFAVINSRYEQGKPTLIVSNLPPKELAGAIGERCVDRLREGGGIVVGFDWESKRGEL